MTEQAKHVIELQHLRARTIGRKRKGDYAAYERVKQVVRAMELTPDEYEQHMQQAAQEMHI